LAKLNNFDRVAADMDIVQDVIEISSDEDVGADNNFYDENNDVDDVENIHHFEKRVTAAMADVDKKQPMVYLHS